MSVAIIIPAYNEEKTVSWIVEKAKKYGEVIVVDDGSQDRTSEFAKKSGAVVFRNKKNSGYGFSTRKGFAKAFKKAEIIVTMDADGQHNPEEIPKLLNKIKKGYNFVLGKRDLSKYPFIKKFGNFFLSAAVNFISGTNLADTESGFRAFDRKDLENFHLVANKYEISTEIIFEVGKHNLKSCNVKIDSPIYVKGVGIADGIKNFLFLLHRREKTWKGYLEDIKYVLKKNFRNSKFFEYYLLI